MRHILFCLALLSASCNNTDNQETTTKTDTVKVAPVAADTGVKPDIKMVEPPAKKIYANARFKDVTVERTADHQFLIKGKAQVFEANISWVVEDGHDELKKGPIALALLPRALPFCTLRAFYSQPSHDCIHVRLLLHRDHVAAR